MSAGSRVTSGSVRGYQSCRRVRILRESVRRTSRLGLCGKDLMVKRERWLVFADDAGDPGEAGTSHFGYAMIAVRREHLPVLTQARAEFRVAERVFGESKSGRIDSERFRKSIQVLADRTGPAELLVATSVIDKSRYGGAWLKPSEGKPAAPIYLRNYVIRKTLEFLFDKVALERCSADLVLDRVDYSDTQLLNLRRYLGGEFNDQGDFKYPRITHVTHADSIYVEGLQLADHVARMAYYISSRGLPTDQKVQQYLRIQTILGGRDFQPNPEAMRALEPRA